MEKFISKRIDMQHLIFLLKKALKLEIESINEYFLFKHNVFGNEAQNIAWRLDEVIKDEYKHAELIANRIKQLGGTVEKLIDNNTINLKKYDSCEVIDGALKSEEESMNIYHEIIQYTENKDHVTCYLATKIMNDESQHYNQFCSFQNDINQIKNK